MKSSRREFLLQVVPAGTAVATLLAAGCARKESEPSVSDSAPAFRALEAKHVAVLEILGETLVPGSSAGGLARYIDQQLSGPLTDSKLFIKYLRVEAPFASFYREGLQALDALAVARHGKSFATLQTDLAQTFVGELASGESQGWSGPPADLFLFVIRSDAVDVVYGTPAGFAKLDIPYMAHIMPQGGWA
jgi:hypothetical protein